ncbi:hypothetical protein C0989_000686 [Termitomyces sp. Mn162]|nr:hypothetical protein C0989_000686 [Termitomyces sp. Mn162]
MGQFGQVLKVTVSTWGAGSAGVSSNGGMDKEVCLTVLARAVGMGMSIGDENVDTDAVGVVTSMDGSTGITGFMSADIESLDANKGVSSDVPADMRGAGAGTGDTSAGAGVGFCTRSTESGMGTDGAGDAIVIGDAFANGAGEGTNASVEAT